MLFLYWTKDLTKTLNLTLNLTLNHFFILCRILVILTTVDFHLTIKDHVHDLAKLLYNNEQEINTLDI
jgi:predicted Zn-dependent protease